MPRSGADARHRLQQAALQLFEAQGFDDTTAAQIAERAGVTERTFFRHFADKREVLFDGQDDFLAALLDGLAATGDGPPLAMLFHAYRASFSLLEGNRPIAGPRYRVIGATPALKERENAKLATVNAALAAALTARGVAPEAATLASATGMAAFGQATERWLADAGKGDLDDYVRAAFTKLKSLTDELTVPSRSRKTRS